MRLNHFFTLQPRENLPRKSRSAQLSSAPLLFRTGRLHRSLTEPGPEHIEELSEGQLLFGTRVPYAAGHQWGTVHLPARPVLTAEMLGGPPAGRAGQTLQPF